MSAKVTGRNKGRHKTNQMNRGEKLWADTDRGSEFWKRKTKKSNTRSKFLGSLQVWQLIFFTDSFLFLLRYMHIFVPLA